ncbi:hypothetical protein D9O36_02345 [Zobellia amurskyensis]|uniref:Uncharacterized protein n=1 Tax=Zobellia amurskyensis TaxID=248905 RepID=A0A7X3D0J0_9FLAO|nr:hypothetical protein [Zobellia amurskyensis]MUH42206.1 hypothetical protein [Zobellia laminariae]
MLKKNQINKNMDDATNLLFVAIILRLMHIATFVKFHATSVKLARNRTHARMVTLLIKRLRKVNF